MEHYATREELNGFGERVRNLEVAQGKSDTIGDRNSKDIQALITYTNGLLMKVAFVSCIPVVIALLIQLFNK